MEQIEQWMKSMDVNFDNMDLPYGEGSIVITEGDYSSDIITFLVENSRPGFVEAAGYTNSFYNWRFYAKSNMITYRGAKVVFAEGDENE